MSHRFAAAGANQFANDVRAISALVDGYIPGISSSLSTLEEAVRLLNIPLQQQQQQQQHASTPSGGDEEDDAEVEKNRSTTVVNLKNVTDRVFLDNSEAKKVLEELSIHTLTPANARQILQRRVENAE